MNNSLVPVNNTRTPIKATTIKRKKHNRIHENINFLDQKKKSPKNELHKT